MFMRGSFTTGRIGRPGPFTFENYHSIYGSVDAYTLLGTTLVYAGAVTLASVAVGMALAWIAVRTNAPLPAREA